MKSVIAFVLFAACASQVYSACTKTYPKYSHKVATPEELGVVGHHYGYPVGYPAGYYPGLAYPHGPAYYPYAPSCNKGPVVVNYNHPSVSSYKRPGPCSCGNCLSCKARPENLYYSEPLNPTFHY
uniref:VM domain-containing protein n=1 Tax=Anopheles coluzzii TaxID=1518534 RepID=A0A6E8VQK0_ANOCL